jgi:hypothetical protein
MSNTKRRRPLGKPGRGWEGSIEIDRNKLGGMAWNGFMLFGMWTNVGL